MPPDLLALLTRFPKLLAAHLENLPEETLDTNEGPNTWTIREVVAHLADLEVNAWLPRINFILKHGPTQPLPVINREAFRNQKTANPLEAFTTHRAQNLANLKLTDSDLDRQGLHPALGVVTISQLIATWATHDLSHLNQITRILAHQNRHAVGPWRAYLRIL
jgi:uncharacterized damage-inducible protein DinB